MSPISALPLISERDVGLWSKFARLLEFLFLNWHTLAASPPPIAPSPGQGAMAFALAPARSEARTEHFSYCAELSGRGGAWVRGKGSEGARRRLGLQLAQRNGPLLNSTEGGAGGGANMVGKLP